WLKSQYSFELPMFLFPDLIGFLRVAVCPPFVLIAGCQSSRSEANRAPAAFRHDCARIISSLLRTYSPPFESQYSLTVCRCFRLRPYSSANRSTKAELFSVAVPTA